MIFQIYRRSDLKWHSTRNSPRRQSMPTRCPSPIKNYMPCIPLVAKLWKAPPYSTKTITIHRRNLATIIVRNQSNPLIPEFPIFHPDPQLLVEKPLPIPTIGKMIIWKFLNLLLKYLQPFYSHWLCYVSHCNLAVIVTSTWHSMTLRSTVWD